MIRFAWSSVSLMGSGVILGLRIANKIGQRRQFPTEEPRNRFCYGSMFQLGLRTCPHRKVVNPRPDGSRHVEPGRAVHGKDLSGTLLGHTQLKKADIGAIAGHKGLSNDLITLRQHLKGKVIDAVLSVLGVLPTECGKLRAKGDLCISLTELLKGKATVP